VWEGAEEAGCSRSTWGLGAGSGGGRCLHSICKSLNEKAASAIQPPPWGRLPAFLVGGWSKPGLHTNSSSYQNPQRLCKQFLGGGGGGGGLQKYIPEHGGGGVLLKPVYTQWAWVWTHSNPEVSREICSCVSLLNTDNALFNLFLWYLSLLLWVGQITDRDQIWVEMVHLVYKKEGRSSRKDPGDGNWCRDHKKQVAYWLAPSALLSPGPPA
jgi:hypothetical protein